MVTQPAREAEVLAAHDLRAIDLVSKPLSIPVVLHRIRRALDSLVAMTVPIPMLTGAFVAEVVVLVLLAAAILARRVFLGRGAGPSPAPWSWPRPPGPWQASSTLTTWRRRPASPSLAANTRTAQPREGPAEGVRT